MKWQAISVRTCQLIRILPLPLLLLVVVLVVVVAQS
jgi:hypothetical protein